MAIDRIRFHLDENVDPDIATALRRHDVDVTTTNDAATADARQFDTLGACTA
jgi:hypothetical protein